MLDPEDLGQVWEDARKNGVRLFGAGKFARAVAQALHTEGICVTGFLTSDDPSLSELDGTPVTKLATTPADGRPIWVAVFNREANSNYRLLAREISRTHPNAFLIWPQAYYPRLQEKLGFRFWLHQRTDYKKDLVQMMAARARLNDEGSRQLFDQILAFRTRKDNFEKPPEPSLDLQYLPEWLFNILLDRGISNLRCVDGGAYHGETLLALNKRIPISQGWTFEPAPENYKQMVECLRDSKFVVSNFPIGLSDQLTWVGLSGDRGDGVHIDQRGILRVPTVAFDVCAANVDVNFIKLDVEGHELQALQGAYQTILRCRPVLAIAAYHRWNDLWRLIEWIKNLNLTYEMRLMSHGHNTFETVLYAY